MQVTFTGKLTKKIVKFCRISQLTEAVVFNVKQCSLKMHDSVLLSRVSNECEHGSLYVSKVKPVKKIQVATEMLAM